MKRNDLPDLSKPLRTLDFDQKREKLKFQNFEKNQKNLEHRNLVVITSNFYYSYLPPILPFWGRAPY